VKSIQLKTRGFTILEVMLATTIFALVVVSLASALNQSIRNSTVERMGTHVRLMLDTKLAEARQDAQQQVLAPNQGWQKIDSDEFGVTYEKQILLKNFKNNKDKVLPNIYSLTIRAKWEEGKLQQQESAEIFFYKAQ
jgi:type II secretion system protein I